MATPALWHPQGTLRLLLLFLLWEKLLRYQRAKWPRVHRSSMLYICSLYMLYMYMLLYIPGVCSSLKAWLLKLCTPRYESTHLEEKPWYDGKGHLLSNHENTLSLHPHALSQMNSEISSIYLFWYLKPYVVAAFPKEIISPLVTFCFKPPKIIKMLTHMKPHECRRKPLYFR